MLLCLKFMYVFTKVKNFEYLDGYSHLCPVKVAWIHDKIRKFPLYMGTSILSDHLHTMLILKIILYWLRIKYNIYL